MRRPGVASSAGWHAGLAAAAAAALLLCVCLGSVNVPLGQTLEALWHGVTGQAQPDPQAGAIIWSVRFPRVLCVALVGASLALCGAAMQGLLRNPLADGSTLGVSSGAALGAVAAIALGFEVPGLPYAGVMIMAMASAFLSLLLILGLTYRLDRSLATHTIILMGVVYSMFAQSIISFIIVFSGERIRSITFWTMGSLAQGSYRSAGLLLAALGLAAAVLLRHARELDAFALGEEKALHVGIRVKRVKMALMVSVACLTGVCVAIGGSIGFVGLVVPQMARRLLGPAHGRLLPACLLSGAVFLLLAELAGRVALRPLELPVGVVTSFAGSIVFVLIFFGTRKTG